MSPWLVLLLGLSALLGCGVPVLRESRVQAAHRRHLDARLETLRPQEDQIEALTLPPTRGAVNSGTLPRSLRIDLARAGVTLQWRTVILAITGLLACGIVLTVTAGPIRAGFLCLVIAAAGYGIFRIVATRRLATFVEALPGYLDATRQLLLVGNSLQQAMVKSGLASSPTVARHIAPMLRRIEFGAPPAESILWLAERLDVMELHMLAAAVQTNARYGGRISTVLGNLTQILRDRARIGRELRSATAETRMSGIVLAALPVCVAAFVSVTNPKYIRFFFDTQQGHHMVLLAIGLEIAGVLVMRRLMRLDF